MGYVPAPCRYRSMSSFTSESKITDGIFHLDMTGMDVRVNDQYFPITTSIAAVKWEPAIGQFTMADTRVSVAESTGTVSGVFKLGLDQLYGPIVGISISAKDVAIHDEAGAPPEPFSNVTFQGWSAPLYGATGIDQFEARKADGSRLVATGRVDMVRRGTGFDLRVGGDGLSADDIKRLWPAFMAKDRATGSSRTWSAGITASTMRYSFPVGTLGAPGENKPMPKNSMSIDITGVGVKIKALETMDPIAIDGEMKLTMRDTDITMSADGATIPTPKGNIGIANAAFVIGANSDTEGLFEISGDLSSGIPALLEWTKREPARCAETGGAAGQSRRHQRQLCRWGWWRPSSPTRPTTSPRASSTRSTAPCRISPPPRPSRGTRSATASSPSW